MVNVRNPQTGRVERVKPSFERVMSKKTKDRLVGQVDELATIMPNLRARHDPLLHETPEAIADVGEMLFCPECRAKLLIRRVIEGFDQWEEPE